MREVINEINRVDDEENDFIFTNNIKISDFLTLGEKKKVDDYDYEPIIFDKKASYSKFIMNVINTAIEVTHDNK